MFKAIVDGQECFPKIEGFHVQCVNENDEYFFSLAMFSTREEAQVLELKEFDTADYEYQGVTTHYNQQTADELYRAGY